MYNFELKPEEIEGIVGKSITLEQKENFMSAAELLMQRGLEKGRQEGWQEGRDVGIQQGRQEGLQEGLSKALQRMVDSGIDDKLARSILGL